MSADYEIEVTRKWKRRELKKLRVEVGRLDVALFEGEDGWSTLKGSGSLVTIALRNAGLKRH